MYMYEGLLENTQNLYLYGSVIKLYDISNKYWIKLGYIILSFPYLIHTYMDEAVLGFWKGC